MAYATYLVLIILLSVGQSFADSSYIYLFESAAARSAAGLARQEARRNLANRGYARMLDVYQKGAASSDELDQSYAAMTLAELDYQISANKSEQAKIARDLAVALGRNGQPVPLCKRRPQRDENAASRYLKKVKATNFPSPVQFESSGTKIELEPEANNSAPPKVEPPFEPTPPIQPPTPPDPPEVPVKPVPPKPGTKPPPKSPPK